MNQNLEQLKKLAQIFNTDKLISPEEIQQIFKGIVEILATYKKDTSSINEDTKSVVNNLLEEVISTHKESVNAVEEKKKELTDNFAEKLTELKQMIDSFKAEMEKEEEEMPEDDSDDEEEKQALIEEIMAQIKLPEVKATIVSGEEIIDKINELDLSDDNKIDYARLKNVPVIKGKVISGSPTVLANAVDLDGSTRQNNYAIVWDAARGRYTHAAGSSSGLTLETDGTPNGSQTLLNLVGGTNVTLTDNGTGTVTIDATGGGGGTVDSVVAGTNISVDNTDPANPIVSSLSDRYKTTSTTSQAIVSTGSLTFTVGANLSYTPLQEVSIVYDSSNHMHGTVTSYSGTTLNVDITHKTGAGTYAAWTINLDGTPVDALTGSGTINQIAYFTGGQVLGSLNTTTYPSLTELSYVKGTTSSIQTQLNTKINEELAIAYAVAL